MVRLVRDGAGAFTTNAVESGFAIGALKGKKNGSMNCEADELHDDGETCNLNVEFHYKRYGFEQRRTERRCVGECI